MSEKNKSINEQIPRDTSKKRYHIGVKRNPDGSLDYSCAAEVITNENKGSTQPEKVIECNPGSGKKVANDLLNLIRQNRNNSFNKSTPENIRKVLTSNAEKFERLLHILTRFNQNDISAGELADNLDKFKTKLWDLIDAPPDIDGRQVLKPTLPDGRYDNSPGKELVYEMDRDYLKLNKKITKENLKTLLKDVGDLETILLRENQVFEESKK